VTQVTLNKAEQKLAEYLARCRYAAARRNGIPDERIGPQSSERTDLEGIAAEIAYCKLMNVYPDTETNGERPVADALLKNGQLVDAKATQYRNGHLLVRMSKRDKPCDLYALMIGTFPTYRLAGHMSKEELLQDCRLKDLGYGAGFTAKQHELKPHHLENVR